MASLFAVFGFRSVLSIFSVAIFMIVSRGTLDVFFDWVLTILLTLVFFDIPPKVHYPNFLLEGASQCFSI